MGSKVALVPLACRVVRGQVEESLCASVSPRKRVAPQSWKGGCSPVTVPVNELRTQPWGEGCGHRGTKTQGGSPGEGGPQDRGRPRGRPPGASCPVGLFCGHRPLRAGPRS